MFAPQLPRRGEKPDTFAGLLGPLFEGHRKGCIVATLPDQDREQLREAMEALESLRVDRERGTPFDTSRDEFTVDHAALLCAEIEIREGGFLHATPDEMLGRHWNDKYDDARKIRAALIRAVTAGEFGIVESGADEIDPRATKLPRDQLKIWCEAHRLRPAFLFPEDGASKGAEEAPSNHSTAKGAPAVPQAPPASIQPAWHVREVKRADALRRALIESLQEAHREGMIAPPTATVIVSRWMKKSPACVTSVGIDRVDWLDDNNRPQKADKGTIGDRLGELIERQGSPR